MLSGDKTPFLLLYLFYSSDICTIKYSAMVDTFLPGSNNSGEWVLSKVSLHGGYFPKSVHGFSLHKKLCRVKKQILCRTILVYSKKSLKHFYFDHGSVRKEMQSPQRATTFWIQTLVLSRAVMQSFGCLPSENSKKVLGTE